MIYRKLPSDQADKLCSWCETLNIRYQINNPEELIRRNPGHIEIGLERENWEKYYNDHQNTPANTPREIHVYHGKKRLGTVFASTTAEMLQEASKQWPNLVRAELTFGPEASFLNKQ